MKERTCCFTGHRKLPVSQLGRVVTCLNSEIEQLIQSGVTTFLSGGALGFDQTAAALIASKKKQGYAIRLELALPYPDQDRLWPQNIQSQYRQLLESADSVHYLSELYAYDCIRQRNRYLVEHSAFCICALLRSPSGTAQTVHYAEQNGLSVINVADRSGRADEATLPRAAVGGKTPRRIRKTLVPMITL